MSIASGCSNNCLPSVASARLHGARYLTVVAACSVSCQRGVGDAVCLSLSGGVAEYRGQEGLPGELVYRRVGVSGDAGRAGNGAQQRDLPDSLATPAPPQEP